jgi:alpha-mannosidase
LSAAAAPEATWRVHVVPHTHWDREWYLPLEAFRIRLAHTIDEAVEVLEQRPEMCFTLDGQAVILEDYEEHRSDPARRARLQAMLDTGRLVAGPAYVQPDELLVGAESLVRNLLVGAAVCRRHGAEPAPLGYAPDAFGHVAQMPQILRGFGLDHFIFTRGFGEEADAGAVLWWEGPDGSRVLAIPLLTGYGSASSLGMEDGHGHWITDPAAWPDTAAARIRELLDRVGPAHRAIGLEDVLACNGVDHRRIQRNLPEMLDACAERIPGTTYRICRYEDFVAAVREQLPRLPLRTTRGELVSGRHHRVTRGVNSTRLELKRANEAVERVLQSSEALAALAGFRDDYDDPRETFELAWRHLLRAHPHDSIAGCSVDQVHRDMRQRFDAAREIADRLGQEALVALAGRGREAIWHYAGAPSAQRSVVNVLPWRRRRAIELPLPPDLAGAGALHARTDAGRLPVQVAGGDGDRRAVLVAELAPFGALPLELAVGHGPAPPDAARATSSRTLENAFVEVAVARDGTLTVADRTTGRAWSGLHRFEDAGDRGDEYTFCPVDGETPWTSSGCEATTRVVEPGPLRAELEVRLTLPLPAGVSDDRRRRVGSATCTAVTRVRLEAGADRVELQTRLVNRASDHRLRVHFPDPTGDPARVRAQGAFAVVERPARPEWDERWDEPPALTGHTGGVVCAGALCVLSRGLPEYEAIPLQDGGVDLALTLLRAVGWLSRDDLSTRPVAAGPAVPVPDAQGLGEHVCEYALSVRGASEDAELVRIADDYRFELADGPGRIELDGVLDAEGERFACSALKGAEDGDGIVLRVHNPGADPGWVRVGGAVRDVERCRLDETRGERVDGRLELGPYEIATLRIRPTASARDARPPAAPDIPGLSVPPG